MNATKQHHHDWTPHVSPVTTEKYYTCQCGEVSFATEEIERQEQIIQETAAQLAKIMVEHLKGLSQEEKEQRIEAGRKVLDAIRGREAQP